MPIEDDFFLSTLSPESVEHKRERAEDFSPSSIEWSRILQLDKKGVLLHGRTRQEQDFLHSGVLLVYYHKDSSFRNNRKPDPSQEQVDFRTYEGADEQGNICEVAALTFPVSEYRTRQTFRPCSFPFPCLYRALPYSAMHAAYPP